MFYNYRGTYVEMVPVRGDIIGVKAESRAVINRCFEKRSATFQVELEYQLKNRKKISESGDKTTFLRIDPNQIVLAQIQKDPILFDWENDNTKLFKVAGENKKLLLVDYVLKCSSEVTREIIFQLFYKFSSIAIKINEPSAENVFSEKGGTSSLFSEIKSSEFNAFGDFFNPAEEDELESNEQNFNQNSFINFDSRKSHPFFVSEKMVEGFDEKDNPNYEAFDRSYIKFFEHFPSPSIKFSQTDSQKENQLDGSDSEIDDDILKK
eukprot:Anaeramoba_ignava/c16193_g1_i3.p1 GENE.c16193_g1_i3~~c16193_g1_i3.p1  ORF type:complete len:265 (+),score=94.24 c16193_g1_i3:381-1175(+)